jgi:hypothetical protein
MKSVQMIADNNADGAPMRRIVCNTI